MNVLIACEESQRVCIEFRKRGHNAFSCDKKRCSGGHPEWHIVGDVMKVLYPKDWIHYPDGEKPDEMYGTFNTEDGTEHSLPPRWDLLIADPPGELLGKCGARWMYPNGKLSNKRLKEAEKQKVFFIKLLGAPVEKICVTNPVPLKVIGLPKSTQTIQPYQFGEPYSKETRVWLKNLEPLEHTKVLESHVPWVCSNASVFARTGYGGSRGIAHGKVNTGKTFQGIAEAMATQWGSEL